MIRRCLAVLLALPASAGQSQVAGPADISLQATLDARSVKVEQRGRAEIRAWAEPEGGSVAQSSGGHSSRRFDLRIDARIADLLGMNTQSGRAAETTAPEPR